MAGEDVVDRVAASWDAQAAGFDEEPDHGLGDETVRAAWRDRLRTWLPAPPADVIDLGCGTGSLSVLLARDGYRLTGVDISKEMVRRARAKADASGVAVRVHQADAANPPVEPGSADVVLVRHLVWTLPDPQRALACWARLLRPGGQLVLVEGRWMPDGPAPAEDDALSRSLPWFGGVDAATLTAALQPIAADLDVHDLSQTDELWGKRITDERYAIIAHVPSKPGSGGPFGFVEPE